MAKYGNCECYNSSNNSSKLEVDILKVIMEPGSVFSSNFTANLVVYITTVDNINVTEGNVTFYVNGSKVGTSAVSNGVASYKYHYNNLVNMKLNMFIVVQNIILIILPFLHSVLPLYLL